MMSASNNYLGYLSVHLIILIQKMAENCENVSPDFLERNVTSSDLFYLNRSHQHFPCTERHETEKSTKILHIREAAFRKSLAFSEELL